MSSQMICTCCRRWRITTLALEREPGHPRQLLRITDCGIVVRDATSVQEAEAVLTRYGMNLADFVEVGPGQ